MNKPSLVFIFLLSTVAVFAQNSEEEVDNLITDRPDQTESPFTVPKGYFQIETGFLYTSGPFGITLPNGTVSFADDVENFTYNTSLFRYGLTDKIELRLIQEIGNARSGSFSTNTQAVPTLIGTKIHLLNQDGGKPQVAFLAHFGGPILSNEQSGSQADFRFSFEHQLSDKLVLGYNVGGRLDNDLNDFTALYTLVFGYSVTPKLYAFAELYGFLQKDIEADHQIDFGLAYLVNPNFQLDFYTGTGLKPESLISPDTILGFGFSLRIPKN